MSLAPASTPTSTPVPPEAPAQRISPASYRTAVALLLLLIVYGSLYPFTWNFARPQDFIFLGPVGLGDLLENIVLFLPLGWLLAWHYQAQGRARQWLAFAVWLGIALGVATVLQWLQKYLPRTPALSDIVFNMVGHVGGWCAGLLSVRLLHRAQRHHQQLTMANRFALLMVGIWWVAELFPLIPTLDVSTVVDNVKSLWQQPFWQPRRMASHIGMTVLGLEALAQLLRSVSPAGGGRWPRAGVMLVVCAVLAGKFVVIHQSPGLAVVLGIGGGAVVWLGIDHAQRNLRLALLIGTALVTYLVQALWPWQWRAVPEPMRWLPFGSSLSGDIEAVITNVAFECLCFGAVVWTAVRRGADWRLAALGMALLAFGCEWTQRYLPTRTPEITSVVLALGMGWLVSALGRCASIGAMPSRQAC